MKNKLFKDTLHGFTVYAGSKITAWGLIRNKCHHLGLEVPTLDKIILNEVEKSQSEAEANEPLTLEDNYELYPSTIR